MNSLVPQLAKQELNQKTIIVLGSTDESTLDRPPDDEQRQLFAQNTGFAARSRPEPANAYRILDHCLAELRLSCLRPGSVAGNTG